MGANFPIKETLISQVLNIGGSYEKIKSITAFVLSLLFIITIPVQAYAVGEVELQDEELVHIYAYYTYMYSYAKYNSSSHYKGKASVYRCVNCGDLLYDDDYEWTTESHSMSNYAYTGSNYHSGEKHYCQYERYCVSCGYTETKWTSYSCPGNGSCLLPQSITILPSEK